MSSDEMCERPAFANFENRRGPQAKSCGQPLESGKGKKIDSPVDPLET